MIMKPKNPRVPATPPPPKKVPKDVQFWIEIDKFKILIWIHANRRAYRKSYRLSANVATGERVLAEAHFEPCTTKQPTNKGANIVLGTIELSMDSLNDDTIPHECFHATAQWADANKIPRSNRMNGDHDDHERLASFHGRLCFALYDQLIKRGIVCKLTVANSDDFIQGIKY